MTSIAVLRAGVTVEILVASFIGKRPSSAPDSAAF